MAKIVEVTNPVTGQPAQVDQLDHTAQQIDDAIARALPGGYYDKWVSQLVNPNLLDNWYFGSPVDQRQGRVVKPNTTYYSDNTLATAAGTTSAYVTAYRYATGTASGVNYASFKLEDSDTAPTYYAAPENVVRGYVGAGYGIDRWAVTSGVVTLLINDNSITLVNGGTSSLIWYKQPIENTKKLLGKTVTVSALIQKNRADMQLRFGLAGIDAAFAENTTDIQLVCYTAVVNDSAVIHSIFDFVTDGGGISGDSLTIYAVKLELGTQQTLAHQENGVWVLNEIPDYGEQLARCQRRQVIGEFHASPLTYDGNSAYVICSTPVSLARDVSPSLIGTWHAAKLSNNAYVGTGISFIKIDENGFTLKVSGCNEPCYVYTDNGGIDCNL